MWELIAEDNIKYFQFQYSSCLFLYSTKFGNKKFRERFRPVFLRQIHSSLIVDIDRQEEMVGDGLMTRTNRAIGIRVADCLPVYLFDAEKICILHCGWRSIVRGILKKAIHLLKDYRYCLGASIGSCCYEVKDEVAKIFNKEYPQSLTYRDNKTFLDLKMAVIEVLGRENLIGNLDYCTKCHPEYFYSHRGGNKDRRNYAVALLFTC